MKVAKSLSSCTLRLVRRKARQEEAGRGGIECRVGLLQLADFAEVDAVNVAGDRACEAAEGSLLVGREERQAVRAKVAAEEIDDIRRSDRDEVFTIGVIAHWYSGSPTHVLAGSREAATACSQGEAQPHAGFGGKRATPITRQGFRAGSLHPGYHRSSLRDSGFVGWIVSDVVASTVGHGPIYSSRSPGSLILAAASSAS